MPDSDIVTMSPKTALEACEKVLGSLRHSGLHFVMQETPYSTYITIRKRFLKVSASSLSQTVETAPKSESVTVKKDQNLEALEEIIQNLRVEKDSLNEQVKQHSKSLKNITKLRDEKESEAAALKIALKNQGNELINLKSDVKQYNKNLKSKEKDIYALDVKSDNLADTLKRVKSDNSVLLSEKKKLEKKLKQKSKEENDKSLIRNKNNSLVVSTSTSSNTSHSVSPTSYSLI